MSHVDSSNSKSTDLSLGSDEIRQHAESVSPPPEDACEEGASDEVRMLPFSLEFTDPALEAQYGVDAFRTSCGPFVAFCGLDIFLLLIMVKMHPKCDTRY